MGEGTWRRRADIGKGLYHSLIPRPRFPQLWIDCITPPAAVRSGSGSGYEAISTGHS